MTSFSDYVRHLGRGPGRSRHLTSDEAEDAMTRILAGAVAPEAVGAMLMLMRYRTENADEIAGFIRAMRARLPDWSGVGAHIDWPSYASGRSRGAPWFVLAARLLAQAGYPVMMHGWNAFQSHPLSPQRAVEALGLPVANDPETATAALCSDSFVYVPLSALDSRLLELLGLRQVLGLRSPVNTCLRGLNPARAPVSLQGVFHPPYRDLQREAASRLGQETMMVIKGGGGEVERHPGKSVEVYGLRAGQVIDEKLPPFDAIPAQRLNDGARDIRPQDIIDLWTGDSTDNFATSVVLGTAALALYAVAAADDAGSARAKAAELWDSRLDRE